MILATSSSGTFLIVWIVLLVVMMYFLTIRPQSKERKRKDAMLSTLEVGDTILTSSGFYGTVIDVQEEIVIVEFGNNRNCRIPMQRAAVVDIEKPADSLPKAQPEQKTEKSEKKSWADRKSKKKDEEKSAK